MKQHLGQLLGHGAATTRTLVAAQHGLEEYTEEALEVDARVLVETFVLGGNEGVHQVGRQLLIVHIAAVLNIEATQWLTIGRQNFGSQIALGILQLLERWHVAQHTSRQ